MVGRKVSLNVKTKSTLKYDYLPGFLLCHKTDNLQTIETLKKAKNSQGLEPNFLLMQEC